MSSKLYVRLEFFVWKTPLKLWYWIDKRAKLELRSTNVILFTACRIIPSKIVFVFLGIPAWRSTSFRFRLVTGQDWACSVHILRSKNSPSHCHEAQHSLIYHWSRDHKCSPRIFQVLQEKINFSSLLVLKVAYCKFRDLIQFNL